MAESTDAALARQARALLSAESAAAAAHLLRERLVASESPELRCLLGQALRVDGQSDAAEVELRRVLALAPDHREAALSLAFALREQGRIQAATAVILDWFGQTPHAAQETLAVARFLADSRAFAAARDLLERTSGRGAPAELLLAGCALNLGDFQAAQAGFRRVLAIDPGQAAAWLRLAHCQRFHCADERDLGAMHDARKRAADGSVLAASLDFAIGKALDDIGDYRTAAQHFNAANQAFARQQPWSAAEFDDRIATVLAALPDTQPLLPASHGAELLWVLGSPRAGTTLLADRLARHPCIRNRGETHWLETIAACWRQNPSSIATATHLANGYLAQLRQDDAPAAFYLDKNPLNLLWADAARALLPAVRIVCLQRDPRDVALSLWSNHFAHPAMGFSYDLAHIGAFLRGYQRLTTALADCLPAEQFRLVGYADLVHESEAVTAGLWQWLGLVDSPSTRGDQAGGGQTGVATASVFQVREPIHNRSLQRWRHYVDWIPGLAEMALHG